MPWGMLDEEHSQNQCGEPQASHGPGGGRDVSKSAPLQEMYYFLSERVRKDAKLLVVLPVV